MSLRKTPCPQEIQLVSYPWEDSTLPGRTQGRALCPEEEFTFPKGSPKPLSAGADAADSGPSRAHKAQLLLLIDAQLVTAAPGPGSRRDLAVSLGTRGQQEAHTASDEHMPNAVNVEVVVSGLHKSIEQDGTARDKAAWAQVEKPAAPRGRVAVPAADAAYCLGEAEKWGSGTRGLGTQATAGHSQASPEPWW